MLKSSIGKRFFVSDYTYYIYPNLLVHSQVMQRQLGFSLAFFCFVDPWEMGLPSTNTTIPYYNNAY